MGTMERINLNIPSEARKRIARLAKKSNLREGEYLRELVLRALKEVERKEFIARVAVSRTPERRARDLEIADAIERLRGSPR